MLPEKGHVEKSEVIINSISPYKKVSKATNAVPGNGVRHGDLTVKPGLSFLVSLSFFFFVFLPFLGPLQRHMEVPRLGVKSEL